MELQMFLTLHTVTGRSPAELLFNRQFRTELPELSADLLPAAEPHDNAIWLADSEKKEKGRQNAD